MEKSDLLPEPHEPATPPGLYSRAKPWLNIGFTAVLLIAGIWYLVSRVSLAEMGQALRAASLPLILLSLGTAVLTLLLKAWRWQLMFPPDEMRPPASFPAFFWALLLGAYINVLVPFLRLGELARIVALDGFTGISKAQSLATLVLEKSLELIMLGLTMAVLLTAVALPAYLSGSGATLALSLAGLAILIILYLIAGHAAIIIRLFEALFSRLPASIGRRLGRWTIAGLAGLVSLRRRRLAMGIVGLSAAIAVVAVLTPLLLLAAFHLPFGWVEAIILHTAITIALVPPTTPGKIGIFDGVVAFLLFQFGLRDEAVIASVTIVYHLVLILPLIALGTLAASRSDTAKGFISRRWP